MQKFLLHFGVCSVGQLFGLRGRNLTRGPLIEDPWSSLLTYWSGLLTYYCFSSRRSL